MGYTWAKAAAIRAARTMAQGAIAMIGTNMVSIINLDWMQIIGCVATMGILSVLTSIAGLPEVDTTIIRYDDEVVADIVKEVTESEVKRNDKA